ncbi:MAG: hypothetical protein ABIG08_01120 [bacterium]
MQIFEFHFNPKSKSDLIFESFCYEPENVYERRLGSLYMLGSLKQPLPKNIRFLDNLAKTIKEKYYKPNSANTEKALRDALKKTNEFLENIAKQGDVSWLGNLNLVVVSLKNFELNFTKVGNLKICLLRKGQIIDIEEKLKFEDIEPYPLKIFGNIVSGKLAEDDIILIQTKEVFDFLLKENILNEIAKISPFEQKKLKEAFNNKKEPLSKISGACLLMVLTKEYVAKEKEVFSLKKSFGLPEKALKLPKLKLRFSKPILKLPKTKLKLGKTKLKLPGISFKLPKIQFKIKGWFLRKNATLILFLILFSVIGFFIFEKREAKEIKNYQNQLNQIQEKVNEAETYLIMSENNPQAEKKANSLLGESWEEISPLAGLAQTFPSSLASQILSLKENISEHLFQLNKLEKIEEIQPIFEFASRGFIPQKIISDSENLYFFSPYSENLFKLTKEFQGSLIETTQKFSLAAAAENFILFFQKPNQLTNFQENELKESVSLKTPYPDFSFDSLSTYYSSLYLLDKTNGKIVKYPYFKDFQWKDPKLWLENQKAKDFKSMAVDGSIWILNKDNSLERYYAGELKETLKLEIFPNPKLFSKIFTSPQLPYLYLLEPLQKRIVVLNKSGKIVKQFQSEYFDNLLDFTLSQDGKTIYLLNGLKVYKILF